MLSEDWLPKDLTEEERHGMLGAFLHQMAETCNWNVLEHKDEPLVGIECDLEGIMKGFLVNVVHLMENWGQGPEITSAVECTRSAWLMQRLLKLLEDGLTEAIERKRDVERRVN